MNEVKSGKYVKSGIGYLALLFLGFFFLIHAIPALQGHPGFLFIITEIGIPLGLAKILLFIVGLIDLGVVAALFFYRKKWVLIYAGLWPLVPNIMGSALVKQIAWTELFLGPILAGIAYWAFFVGKK